MTASDLPEGFILDTLFPADLETVATIEAATQATPWSRNLFASCLDNDYYVCEVVRHFRQPVAFQILSFVLNEAHLMNIAVAPAFQHRGIGRALVMHALDEGMQRGTDLIYLEVRSSNVRAQRLYESIGFKQHSLRRNYYRTANGKEDAWLMLKNLQTHSDKSSG